MPDPAQTTEPPAAGATPGEGTSTPAGQTQPDATALQQKLEKLQAENDTLQQYRGFQKEFTRANQTGVYKVLMGAAEQPGGVQGFLDSIKQSTGLTSEVEALGGLDKLKEAAAFYADVMAPGATPANPPAGGTPAQAPAQAPALTAEDVKQIVLEVNTVQSRQQQLNDAYSNVSDQVIEGLGVTTGTDVASAKCRTLLKDEAERLAQGRDVTLEDITVAAQSVQKFLADLRATGAQVVEDQNQRQPTTPPGMNGPGPGGQPPGKPISEMTDAEVNALATARASKVLPQGPVGAEDLPKGWSRG